MIRQLRAGFFWIHFALGVVGGLFILNMAVSGILISYEHQVLDFAEQAQRKVKTPGPQPLDVETLTNRVRQSYPDKRITGIVIYSDPLASVQFTLGREDGVLYVDRYSGAVLGQGHGALRNFFRFVTGWHRWLALEGTQRPIGKAVTGAVSLSFFTLLLSGLVLWLPLKWSSKAFKRGIVLNPRLKGRARHWNWHRAIAFWCAPFLLLVTLTGIIMSYDWANDLVFRLTGSPIPERRQENEGQNEGKTDPSSAVRSTQGLNLSWAEVEKSAMGWRSISQRFSGAPSKSVSFSVDFSDGTRPNQISRMTLDRKTGAVLRWQTYATENPGQQVRSWVRWIHTGEAGGIVGQTVAVLTSIGSILLVWTGISMAIGRAILRVKMGQTKVKAEESGGIREIRELSEGR
jgi:uncharacterized iron-regulated membrane protein